MAYIGNQLTSSPFIADNFTGDGSTKAFTLSATPASATSILVLVNGLKKIASGASAEYTVSGTTLSFVSAPALNATIEVIQLGLQSSINIPADASVTANQLSTQLRQIISDNFTANGTGQTFNLSTTPVSANSLIVSSNGIVQYDYTTSGSTLIFNFTPPSGAFIRVSSVGILATGNVANDAVGTAQIQNDSVTNAKLALTYSSQANTGNGTGQTYTISSGYDANSLLVFYNGLALLPVTDYSVSGTTLILTFAPLNNSNVSIRYLPN